MIFDGVNFGHSMVGEVLGLVGCWTNCRHCILDAGKVGSKLPTTMLKVTSLPLERLQAQRQVSPQTPVRQ